MTTENAMKVLIDQARNVAEAAHRGQKRRDGGDYFKDHVEPVAASVDDRLKPIAYLHDVIEDTDITLEDLRNANFPEYVLRAVDVLTHKNNEPNVAYWTRIAQNKDATAVKLADIRNNLSGQPSERQQQKYAQALQLFAKFGYKVPEHPPIPL